LGDGGFPHKSGAFRPGVPPFRDAAYVEHFLLGSFVPDSGGLDQGFVRAVAKARDVVLGSVAYRVLREGVGYGWPRLDRAFLRSTGAASHQ
jgi:hypothetical protein